MTKNPCANAGDEGSISGLGRHLGGAWQSPPVFLPGESHGQRSLVVLLLGPQRVGHDSSGLACRVRWGKGKPRVIFLASMSLFLPRAGMYVLSVMNWDDSSWHES